MITYITALLKISFKFSGIIENSSFKVTAEAHCTKYLFEMCGIFKWNKKNDIHTIVHQFILESIENHFGKNTRFNCSKCYELKTNDFQWIIVVPQQKIKKLHIEIERSLCMCEYKKKDNSLIFTIYI